MTHLHCNCTSSTLAAGIAALFFMAACGPSGTASDEGDNPDDTASAGPLSSGSFADTEVPDWMPVTSGNWPNGLTADTCNSGGGPVCYDCLHVPTGTYARWFRVETEGGGYGDDQWFEAVLGQLTFSDFNEEQGSGIGTDGAYYAFDTVQACAPAYWLYE